MPHSLIIALAAAATIAITLLFLSVDDYEKTRRAARRLLDLSTCDRCGAPRRAGSTCTTPGCRPLFPRPA